MFLHVIPSYMNIFDAKRGSWCMILTFLWQNPLDFGKVLTVWNCPWPWWMILIFLWKDPWNFEKVLTVWNSPWLWVQNWFYHVQFNCFWNALHYLQILEIDAQLFRKLLTSPLTPNMKCSLVLSNSFFKIFSSIPEISCLVVSLCFLCSSHGSFLIDLWILLCCYSGLSLWCLSKPS